MFKAEKKCMYFLRKNYRKNIEVNLCNIKRFLTHKHLRLQRKKNYSNKLNLNKYVIITVNSNL